MNSQKSSALSAKEAQKILQKAFAEKDIWTVISILHIAKGGLLDYICNEIYAFSDKEIELFIPQLCTKLLKEQNANSLERFLFDKCSNLHLAFKMFFWFQSAEEDGTFPKQRSNSLWHECEMAAVNQKSRSSLRVHDYAKHVKKEENNTLEVKTSLQRSNSSPSLQNLIPSATASNESNGTSHNDSLSVSWEPPTAMQRLGERRSSDYGESRTISPATSNGSIEENAPAARRRNSSVVPPYLHVLTEEEETGLSKSENSTLTKPGKDEIVEKSTMQPPHANTEPVKRNQTPEDSPAIPQIKLIVPPSPTRIELLDADNINSKKSRHFYFQAELHFLSCLTNVSSTLKKYSFKTKSEYNFALISLLRQLQQQLLIDNSLGTDFYGSKGLYLPIHNAHSPHLKIVRLLPEESFCLSSKDRVPFMFFLETIADSEVFPGEEKHSKHEESSGIIQALEKMISYNREMKEQSIQSKSSNNVNNISTSPNTNSNMKLTASVDDGWTVVQPGSKGSPLSLAYPELWHDKAERIRKTSPFGKHPRWQLQSVIVKSGDDLRQEQLAMQLISTMDTIFRDAELSLWLRPYAVVATSFQTGLIETIPDSISLDGLKKRFPNMTSLCDYFVVVYGEKTSIDFLRAQRNFVESLAAYSLVCYILQIKDRHNGNILIDKDGHIIHIDYGFMLSSSPGSLNFETAPFKLTNEFLQVMGGEHGDMFHYFRLMFMRGFLEIRKHAEKIILLVEMLLPGQRMGCFARKEATIRELRDRFQLSLSEKECMTFVSNLIRESMGRWTTEAYDNYQWFWNGILA